MRKMKDSGDSVIGTIPGEWTLQRFKAFGEARNGLTYSPEDLTDESGSLVLRSSNIQDGKLAFEDTVYVNTHVKPNLRVKGGDILICSRNGSRNLIGKNALIPDGLDATFGAFMMLYRTTLRSRYVYYILNSPIFSTRIGSFLTTTINQLTVDTFLNMRFPFCSNAEEQNCIVRYLDSKCAEIDSLRSDIQAQIETLEEYKRSVVTEAVTHGLNPDTPMKDSGIPWIGQIPAHWEVERLKHYLHRFEPKNPGEKQVLSLYREYGVVPKDSRNDNYNVTSDDTSKYKYVRIGDFVVNKMKAWQGSVAVSAFEGIVSPAYYVYRFRNQLIDTRYFHFLIRSAYKDEFMRLSSGIRVDQWDLPSSQLDLVPLIVPPIVEQKKIVSFLKSQATEIDSLITAKREQLATLAEYRKSLIFEYITGKKEVPAA